MEETPEMESPSARQDCLVEAQEDSTSVEPEAKSVLLSPSKTMATMTIATTPATEIEDNARDSVENSICEKLDRGLENQESQERQLSDYPCLRKSEEEKENELKVGKLEKETSESGKNFEVDIDVESTKDSLQEPEESSKGPDSQNWNKDEEDRIEKKRSSGGDFLPIGAEIRRVGVEISEEEVTQMRNDVRRLSPVLVSLRERTLGEVFLSSQSCLFGDEVDDKTASRNNANSQESFGKNDSGIQDIDQSEKRDVDEEETVIKINASLSECTNSKLNHEEETLDVDITSLVPSRLENSDRTSQDDIKDTNVIATIETTSCTPTKKEALSSPCRHLSVVLNRIKEGDTKNDTLTDENINENTWNIEGSSPCPKRRRDSVEEECDSSSEISKTKERSSKKPRLQINSSPMTRSKKCELTDSQSPDRNLILKKCKVVLERIRSEFEQSQEEESHVEELEAKRPEREELAPVAVIGKLEEDEEVVLTSSSPSGENNRAFNELDSLETTPSSPEEGETPEETSVDVGAEGVDTETETETGSDSSEISPMTNIRELRDVDMASDHQLPCSEEGPLCCVETMAPIMTRLEAERPEAYTEDSAESLTLATGARDEVRSDGSDSGLGNEISGDPGPAPAPESDSETSFLDRLPDDILSDKEKGVNQLDGFAPSSSTSETPGQAPLTSFRTLPPKSNLKRRLTDCMEGDESRSNPDEPVKKKRNIQFDAVTVYYFPRTQGFTCVPSQGGSTLGMSATHTHAERFSLSEHAAEQRRIHRAHLAQLRSERNCATSCVTETASSSEDPSDDTDEEPSDTEELDIDSYYFLQPVPTWQRRVMLRNAGVRRIDAVEKDECRDIRASREHCGCGCKGYCDPESCPCSRANVKCQVDRPGFPCGCTRDGCANSSGRIEFNPVRVRTHFIHTLMRLELEKKQREEEGGGEHTDQVADNQRQSGRGNGGSLRDIDSLGMEIAGRSGDACAIPGSGGGGGFTTLHYETGHEGGVVTAGCQPEVPGTREDSLDLYAIRDDCYASEDTVDGSQSVAAQRKLHPEFGGQAFQSFSAGAQNGGAGGAGGGMSFQQSSYQDYVNSPYANLPSTSRVSQFQPPPPPQFQSSPNPTAFAHYGPYGGTQDAANAALQSNCSAQLHQVPAPPPPGQQQQQQQQQQVEMQQVTEQQLVPQTSVDREQQTQQEIEAQENMDRSGVQSLPIGGSGSEVTDFAETLDLSQEDIQKTLSANMVPPSPSPSPADNSMINPMDFIDSSDDVLVNLDAFDVFGDLPELHDFEADQTKHEEQRGGPENDVGCHPGTTVHIAEYSPEWSYTEGGVKVLVAGPWTGGSGSQSYSVLFDAEPVEACLVQPGVLRCRCPAHAPGIASLQVACDGFVVSDSVAFEYRRAPTSEPSPEKALLDRLADVEARLQGPGPPSPAAHLEERLVAYCQDAVVRPWRAGAEPLQSGGPTLLHLAAGLGYSRLACALLHWRAENPSSVLDAEVDALRQDSAGLTPLAWACAAGHADTARILYRWNAMALRVRDCQNRTATELAAENGHAAISEELNQLEARRQDERLFLRPASPSPRRPSQDSGLDLALCGSPLLDNMELLQEDESSLGLSEQGMESAPTPQETVGEEDARVLTLAEQIIAALPERIKRAEGDSPSSSSPPPLAAPLSPLEDALMEQMPLDSGELFDSYRDCNGGAASISDADADADASPSSPSSSCLTPDSPSPPPTTADFCEFLQLQLHLDGNGNAHNAYYSPNGGERRLNGMLGSGALTATASDGGSEADLSRLTLSDREQRELYHAARMIQKAYRNYKGRQRQEEAERHAAVLIQQYYRRHKQYAYHRQATRAALVIQNNYRNYRARPGSTSIRQQAVHQQAAHQAARKIQQFMRQSKINLSWDDSRPTAERQGRRKREREAASGHFTGGCCPPKLALI